MTAAIFGLIGVVVGGVITGGVDFLLEWRRERNELRKARRLVASEISTLRTQQEVLVRSRKTPKVAPREWSHDLFPSRIWEQHSATLASGLTDEEWRVVDEAYAAALPLKLELITREAGSPLEDEFIESVSEAKEVAEAAETILQPPSE